MLQGEGISGISFTWRISAVSAARAIVPLVPMIKAPVRALVRVTANSSTRAVPLILSPIETEMEILVFVSHPRKLERSSEIDGPLLGDDFNALVGEYP